MSRPDRHRAPCVAALICAAALVACSSDETTTPALPEGPPDLAIASLQAPGVFVTPGATNCFPLESNTNGADTFVVALKTDKGGRIPLFLPDGSTPRFWTFEPPDGCAGAPDCGYALLLIDPDPKKIGVCNPKTKPAFSTIAAGPSISVSFDALRKALAGQYGVTTVRVELWPGVGQPGPLCKSRSNQVQIDFEPSCGSSDAGADGSPLSDGGRDGSADASDGRLEDSSSDGKTHDASDRDVKANDAARDGASAPRDGSSDANGDGPG